VAVSITPDDLAPFASIAVDKAQAMIDDALAMAALVAPCINDADFAFNDAAKAIIRGAVLRWNDAGTGVLQQQGAGPFQQTIDTRQTRRQLFWPSEIEQLRKLCETSSGAFGIDTLSTDVTWHADVCSLAFGALDCSCGGDIAGFPLYEV
jgi:hypothetical protein